MEELWHQCLQDLQREIPIQQFNAWLKDLSCVDFVKAQGIFRVTAPNRFKLDWVKTQYANRISHLLTQYVGSKVQLQLELANKTIPANAQQNAIDNTPTKVKEISASIQENSAIYPETLIQENGHTEKAQLFTNLTFDNFVAGKANQLARAAALQIADNPATSYNPLFLYGGVGLGKTHLIHAIGNSILQQNRKARVRYIHAQQYVSDVVRAYQRKSFDEFKRYYHSLDLLLIDDIQFFGGKSRTQEEFFYAFEALINARKQIIITSDTYPKELAEIDERLKSRFDCGLTVAIEPPELEMRVAILIKKSAIEGIVLGEEVAFFVAKHLRQNVRELEGALRKILAYCRFHHKPVNVDTSREALKDLLSVQKGQISIENIQKTVADFYKLKVADLYSKRRPNNIALPRQIAMYLAKELTKKSLPEIGEMFGGRDHTTVLHAVRKITEVRQNNTELNHQIHVLEQTLRS